MTLAATSPLSRCDVKSLFSPPKSVSSGPRRVARTRFALMMMSAEVDRYSATSRSGGTARGDAVSATTHTAALSAASTRIARVGRNLVTRGLPPIGGSGGRRAAARLYAITILPSAERRRSSASRPPSRDVRSRTRADRSCPTPQARPRSPLLSSRLPADNRIDVGIAAACPSGGEIALLGSDVDRFGIRTAAQASFRRVR